MPYMKRFAEFWSESLSFIIALVRSYKAQDGRYSLATAENRIQILLRSGGWMQIVGVHQEFYNGL